MTVGLADRVYEDYRLAEEVCNAISKLASNSKVKLSFCPCGHRNSYPVKEKQGTEFALRKENLYHLGLLFCFCLYGIFCFFKMR